MKKQTFVITILVILLCTSSMLAQTIHLPYNLNGSFIREITGEILIKDNEELIEKSHLIIENELSYTKYNSRWDNGGEEYNISDDIYNITNTIRMEWGMSRNVNFAVKVPLQWKKVKYNDIWYRNEIVDNGIGDIIIGIKVDPFLKQNDLDKFVMGAGVKLPTGNYSEGIGISSSGTGSHDLYFTGSSIVFRNQYKFFGSLGYIITGNNKYGIKPGNTLIYKIGSSKSLNPYSSIRLTLYGYNISSVVENDYNFIRRLAVTPELIFLIPDTRFHIGGGLSFDLSGKNTYCGKIYFIQIKIVTKS